MKITYDSEADVLYISFLEDVRVTTKCVTEDIAIDFGKDESVAGIEILGASKRLDGMKRIFSKIDVDQAVLTGK